MTYTLDRPISFKKFKHSTSINHLVINLMEKNNVPFKATDLKSKIKILHYLLTRIIFSRVINHGYVIREDVVPIWILTHEISTNWVEDLVNHMIQCKENSFTKLPYGPMVSKLLATFNVYTIYEIEDPKNPQDHLRCPKRYESSYQALRGRRRLIL